MYQTLDQLKAFMLWCKAEGVQHFEDEKLAFDFSPIVLAPLFDKNAPEPATERASKENAEELSDLYELE